MHVALIEFSAHFLLLFNIDNMRKTILNILLILLTVSTIQSRTKLGIDIVIDSDFAQFKSKKVGLLTNQSGRTSDGRLTAEVFAERKDLDLVAIFVPEHGLFGAVPAGDKIDDENYLGVPVYSLYGRARDPHPQQIAKCDVIVIDIQDIGIRSYTFLSTMYYVIKASAEQNKPVYILDRPNPLGGNIVDGNVLEKGKESFVGIIPISYIHGCTFGELANMINEEIWLGKSKSGKNLKANINIIKMQNWKRSMAFEHTGLTWFPTSPHIPSVDAIRGAAILGIFGELGFINIGIGTTLPFQYIGSPKFPTDLVLKELQGGSFDGVSLYKTRYKPFYAKYSNEFCEGLLLRFYHNDNFLPYQTGAKIFLAIKKHYPQIFLSNRIGNNAKDMFNKVTGTERYFNCLFSYDSKDLISIATHNLNQFKKIRQKYLLY